MKTAIRMLTLSLILVSQATLAREPVPVEMPGRMAPTIAKQQVPENRDGTPVKRGEQTSVAQVMGRGAPMPIQQGGVPARLTSSKSVATVNGRA